MKKLKLKQIDATSTGNFDSKDDAEKKTDAYLQRLSDLSYLMFAEGKRSLLIILQGIDASGKDGTVKHIFSGMNPQGIQVHSFKEPSAEDLRHDFLWRCHKAAPESGMVTIFNRSYYEEVTTVKVHPEYLKAEHLPDSLTKNKKFFDLRYEAINDFEKMLTNSGTTVVKFLLHISKDEQNKRLKERLKDPQKNWKFSPKDLQERKHWDEYMKSFDEMLEGTSTKTNPWHVIPADKKWYRDYLISKTLVEALEGLKMSFPKASAKDRA